jgi:type IV pilus assembly protein PilB
MILPEEKFRELVVNSGVVTAERLAEVEKYAVISGRTLEEALVEKGVTTDKRLGELVAAELKVPFVSLTKLTIPEDVFNIIPERIARKQRAIAFARDLGSVSLAMEDPGKREVQEMVAKKTGVKVVAFLATKKEIDNSLRFYKKDLQKVVDSLLKDDVSSLRSTPLDDPPVAKVVDSLIEMAYQEQSSDVHVEPRENETLVRFRVDGMLQDVVRLQKNLHDRLVTRVKVLSGLRTDEHLSAQDGKMQLQLDEEKLDIRVSIIPITEGEKIVLRLLSQESRQYTLADLGMNESDLAKVRSAYSKSYGMVLSTGPTGSGKTTSIYSMLKAINTREKNITSIEDPVEYKIAGANQVQVNTKTNLTFANGLRSLLRQDPNVIFVGEIRDNETASIAVNAALTGHLVLSTLHTNDAATAIPRLSDMKVEPFLVASTVNIIIAQRLVRQICDSCREIEYVGVDELLKNIPEDVVRRNFDMNNPQVAVYKGRGCKICRNTGYLGRIGVFEVLEVTKKIRKMIVEKKDADEIARGAVEEGMKTMLDDGLEKVSRGLTTLEEILRVTKAQFV